MADKTNKQARYAAMPDAGKVFAEIQRAQQDARGFQCAQCGCNNFAVDDTRRIRDGVRRYRVCRCCGHRITTIETSETDSRIPTRDG